MQQCYSFKVKQDKEGPGFTEAWKDHCLDLNQEITFTMFLLN